MDKKLKELLKEREATLGYRVISTVKSKNGDAHVMGKRNSDGKYAVWTSYSTGEEKTTYVGFYNGKYDLSESEGQKELDKRSKK